MRGPKSKAYPEILPCSTGILFAGPTLAASSGTAQTSIGPDPGHNSTIDSASPARSHEDGRAHWRAACFIRCTSRTASRSLPASILRGTVIQLDSDRSRRIHARLRGDFTPFHIPVVRFDQLILPDGALEPIVSDSAKDGVPILRLSPAPGQKKSSLISRQIAQEKQRVKDAVAQFTAPGRGDRLVQFIYTQLPYHPERIEAGTGVDG